MNSATRSPILMGVTLAGASAIAVSSLAAPPAAVQASDLHLTLSTSPMLENPVDVLAPILQQAVTDASGLITRELNNPAPILRAVLTNQTNNAFSLVNGAVDGSVLLGDAAFNAPAAIVTAGQQVLSGDLPGALATLQNATLVPVAGAAMVAVQTLQGVITNQLAIASRLAVAIPSAAMTIVGATVNAVSQITLAAVQAGFGVFAAAITLNPVTVANAITDGVANVASVAEQTTIGQPAFVAPAAAAAVQAPTVVAARSPSILEAINISRRQIANAISPQRAVFGSPDPRTANIAAPLAAANTAGIATATTGASGTGTTSGSSSTGTTSGSSTTGTTAGSSSTGTTSGSRATGTSDPAAARQRTPVRTERKAVAATARSADGAATARSADGAATARSADGAGAKQAVK
jgi:hypothetical protein